MALFQYSPYLIPLILVAGIVLALGWFIWRRRPGAGVTPFAFMMFAVGLWALAYAVELSLVQLPHKLFFNSVEYVGITLTPASWFAFTLEYTGREKWLTRRNIALLAIEPVLAVIATSINFGQLFRYDIALETGGGFVALTSTPGPLFWVHATYSYILLLAGTVLLIRSFIRSPQLYRGQVAFLLIGSFIPWLANAISIFDLSPFPYLDLTPFSFAITGLAMGWAIYRYRLLDIVPIARDRIIESMNDAVIVVDMQRRIVDANPATARLMGLTSATSAIGQSIDNVFTDQRELVEQYRDVPQARSESVIEVDGEERIFDLRIQPINNRLGELTGRLITLQDITQQKLTEQRIREQNEALRAANLELAIAQRAAEEANQLKSQFLATMSHELRTPLNAIIGFTDMMLSGLVGEVGDKQLEYLSRILANGEHLLDLINEVLDLSKIESGLTEIASESFNVNDLLPKVVSKLQSLADQKQLPLATHIDDQLASDQMGDPGRIEQIIINLVGNAIKFTEEGQVSLELKKVDTGTWGIVVSDTGIGIPPHAIEYIFDEFRQVDGSSEREYGGTGLGLALVKKLTTLMEGKVDVKSELGKGSTFTVTLPYKAADTIQTDGQAVS